MKQTMLKVMIADDEVKICQLIQYLVDWKELDMEVIAMVHNGIEALEVVKEHKPDIAITDIRMPGCNGLSMIEQAKKIAPEMQYIIISGYQDFEYAHKAIQFGVSNYLLKPIDKIELTTTLKKMHSDYLRKTEQLTKEEKLKNLEKNDKQRIRIQFLKELVTAKKTSNQRMNISQLNETYKYQFQKGIVQTFIIKVDGIQNERKENSEYLEEKIRQVIAANLGGCYDWEFTYKENYCYVIVNYSEKSTSMRKNMRNILKELLLQESILNGIQITIGIGDEQELSDTLGEGFKTSRWAIMQRLIKGTNQLIYGENRSANAFVESDVFKGFNKNFCNAIELQDVKEVEKILYILEKEILELPEITGYEILQMMKGAINAYLFALKNNELPMESSQGIFEEFKSKIHDYGTAKEAFLYLRKTIIDNFIVVTEEKRCMDTRPIREAKQYIALHFSDPISLEIVSEVVGFNATYFSSMFKKEMGIGFSEYLLNVRMEKTKEMLKETKKSVADICEEVGYSDVKYFTKKFNQYTSLKPNEYRKLYS